MWTKSSVVSLAFALAIAGCSGSPQEKDKGSDAGPKSPASLSSGFVTLSGENAKIEFVGTKPDGSHKGGFNEFSGKITVDEAAKSVKEVSLEIQTASLWSDDEKLTNHLKSPDFFNVNEHPTATFQSSMIKPTDEASGKYTVTGELTLLGTTKEINAPATIKIDGDKLTLDSEFKIDRTDFGMDFGQGKVDNEVTVRITVGAASEKPTTTASGDQ